MVEPDPETLFDFVVGELAADEAVQVKALAISNPEIYAQVTFFAHLAAEFLSDDVAEWLSQATDIREATPFAQKPSSPEAIRDFIRTIVASEDAESLELYDFEADYLIKGVFEGRDASAPATSPSMAAFGEPQETVLDFVRILTATCMAIVELRSPSNTDANNTSQRATVWRKHLTQQGLGDEAIRRIATEFGSEFPF